MQMQLKRPQGHRQLVSLVPMIDVMLILLVFFMVTSTYLNLDMIPMVERSQDNAPASVQTSESAGTLFIRIGADGRTFLQGQPIAHSDLAAQIAKRLARNPLLSVVILPSSRARTQDLVATLDTITLAGATRLRLIRLDGGK